MLHMGCSQQFIRFVYLMLAECEYVDTIVIDSVDNVPAISIFLINLLDAKKKKRMEIHLY